jgi:hypothetical protein
MVTSSPDWLTDLTIRECYHQSVPCLRTKSMTKKKSATGRNKEAVFIGCSTPTMVIMSCGPSVDEHIRFSHDLEVETNIPIFFPHCSEVSWLAPHNFQSSRCHSLLHCTVLPHNMFEHILLEIELYRQNRSARKCAWNC